MPDSRWQPRAPRWLDALVVRRSEAHISFLLRYLGYLGLAVLIFAALFHLAMHLEGQSHPWWRGPYWAVSTMTTLGLGDIVFEGPLGQALTVAVVLVGVIFMLVLLPLLLIQFPPWVEARSAARVRRRLRQELHGHVVLTNYDPVTESLIRRLSRYGTPYVLIVPDVHEALRMKELGLEVMVGAPDHPETYRGARLEYAALLAATGSEVRNSNAIFTARSVAPDVPTVATVERAASIEVLHLAGSDTVLQLPDMLARALARRVLGGDAQSHVVGRFDQLLIAEANAARTPLAGKTLAETRLRELAGVSVVGVWDRGEFRVAGPETAIGPHTVLVLAGAREELNEYDAAFAIYNVSAAPVIVIGGGRVGQATARALAARGIDCVIVERDATESAGHEVVLGDASDLEVLERAGIHKAPSVVITTHDDDTNVFLALYCRRLRPDIQIVSRATFERNVETLHRAGTDFTLSLASMGSDALFNLLEGGDTVTITEGLNLFRVSVPGELAGRSLIEADLRRATGCSVVALETEAGMRVNPDPAAPLPAGAGAILIGTRESEQHFFERYGESAAPRATASARRANVSG